MVADIRRFARLCIHELESREVPALLDPSQLSINTNNFDPTHVLVKWTDDIAHQTQYSYGPAESLGNGLFRLTLDPGISVSQAISGLNTSSRVAVAEPDYLISVAMVPDDPSFNSLWGMNNTGQSGGTANADISAPEAWNTSTGTKHTIVAIVDTGVDYTHPDLAANMWKNPHEVAGNGRDDDGNGYRDDIYGWNFVSNSANVMDDNGHGTHVAGTIGAVGDNGVGVAGVDWNTRIMALKFLDKSGTGYLSNAVKAINYAVANGAKVINCSFGGGGYDSAMATAIANAKAHGVIVVAAAGNDGTNNDSSPEYPANYSGDNVIAVAATDRNDKLASFSNYGSNTVDIAAPGVSVYSTLPGGKYGAYSGTSMAAPHVTGAIALVWDAHPSWNYRQVIQAILKTGDVLSTLSNKVAHGRLDVAKAITYSFGTTTPTDTTGANVTKASFNESANSISSVRITFSEAIDPKTFTTGDVTLIGPSGAKIAISSVKAVAGSSNMQFDVTFAKQTARGAYSLILADDIRDLAGNLMDQNKNGRNGESSDTFSVSTTLSSAQTFASTNVGQPILDFVAVKSTLTISQDIAIKDLNVQVNLSHTYIGDVRITLIAPDGTKVILFNHRGGNGDNLTNTIFDDRGSSSIYKGTAPFTGSYKPEYVLSTLDGKSAKGTWQLLIEDTARFDTGKLNAWSLIVEGATKASSTSIASSPTRPDITPPPAPQTTKAASLPSAPPVNRDGHVYIGLASYFA